MNSNTNFFIGLDVHSRNTSYAVRTWQGDIILEGECSSMYRDLKAALQSYFHSCVVGIEACTSFYPLRKGFIEDNVQVKVANVLRMRQLIVKNDRLDALRLSDMLRLGTFPESYIPDKEIQTLRNLVSLRHSSLEELNKVQCRIWALLQREGIKLPSRSIFSKKGLAHLKEITEMESCPLDLKHLYPHYEYLAVKLQQTTDGMILYASNTFPKEFLALQAIDGIAKIIASYVIAEVCPVSRFINKKKLRRYAGVVPCFQESGGKSYGSMLPKFSSRRLLRWVLTQAAHCATRKKESKLRLYYERKKTKGKQKAKMAIARAICDLVYYKLNS